jgi:hypothetical protein
VCVHQQQNYMKCFVRCMFGWLFDGVEQMHGSCWDWGPQRD